MKNLFFFCCVIFFACGDSASKNYHLSGTWKETNQDIQCQDTEMQAQLDQAFSANEIITFKEDQTFEWKYLSASLAGEFSFEGEEIWLKFVSGEVSRRKIKSVSESELIWEHSDKNCTYTETFSFSKK